MTCRLVSRGTGWFTRQERYLSEDKQKLYERHVLVRPAREDIVVERVFNHDDVAKAEIIEGLRHMRNTVQQLELGHGSCHRVRHQHADDNVVWREVLRGGEGKRTAPRLGCLVQRHACDRRHRAERGHL